jgi:hypothetical protein
MKVPKLFRTTALAAGLMAASVPSLSVPAEAAWGGFHGSWHGGGWHGGGWHGGGLGFGIGTAIGLGILAGAAYDNNCMAQRVFNTPNGPVVRWVNVCY